MRSSKMPLAFVVLLPALAVGADTAFNGDGWLTAVPVPGILCTNDAGQVSFKGNVHVVRVQANDARVTGRVQAMPDVAFQANGTRLFTGTAYCEVGTWDAAGTNFTAIGGVWDLLYRGVTQADGSVQYTMVGYGIGGAIDGLRTEISVSRGPGDTFDPAIPYIFSGTIKPAPIHTEAVIDDFNDGVLTGWNPGGNTRIPTLTESSSAPYLTMNCDWTGVPTTSPFNTLAWAGNARGWPWSVVNGQTVELRADLVGLNAAADSAVVAFAVQEGGPNYALFKGHDWVLLLKQSGMSLAALSAARVTTPDTGVVLSLGLTGVGQDVVLTARVLDKAQPGTVRGELSFIDTAAVDSVLNNQQVANLTGLPLSGFGPDPGAPYKAGQRQWLGLWQHTDGTEPPAQAAFDNFELGTYGVPRIGIQRAVQVTYPSGGRNWSVLTGPSLQGPWLPAQVRVTPGMESLSLPANGPMEFFRVIQAP